MKRVGNLYDKIWDIENIRLAFKNAAKGKKRRKRVKKILDNTEYYEQQLSELLRTKTLVLSDNKVIEIYDKSSKKKRIITVPRFYPDQIVHWALIQVIQPVIMKGMYRYCCGSVPNRGGAEAMKVTKRAVCDPEMKYVAKLDIHKYFPSIDGEILLDICARKIKDKDCLWLIRMILANGGSGLPIGYYTSQWFSNLYLEELDHYIKEKLRIPYYIRYVDDIVLLHSNKELLHAAIPKINLKLSEYRLSMKPNFQVWEKDSRPIDFVGYRFYSYTTKLRRKIYYHLHRQMRKLPNYSIHNLRSFLLLADM